MTDPMSMHTVFFTLLAQPADTGKVATLVDSLRTFGGPLAHSRFWVFHTDGERACCTELQGSGTSVFTLRAPAGISGYPYFQKVAACARAEEMAGALFRSMVWVSPDCLFTASPVLFDLDRVFDAAVRPVHIRNVGCPAGEPPDPYWHHIYGTVGTEIGTASVESFVDCVRLRAYYNTHAFSVDPSLGLMGEWLDLFSSLVSDSDFQDSCCGDGPHRIFLHQAVFSALLAARLDPTRTRTLPEEYCYPYNLQDAVPADRRAEALNELVCIAYDDRSLDPEAMDDIVVEEPLLSWLNPGAGPTG